MYFGELAIRLKQPQWCLESRLKQPRWLFDAGNWAKQTKPRERQRKKHVQEAKYLRVSRVKKGRLALVGFSSLNGDLRSFVTRHRPIWYLKTARFGAKQVRAVLWRFSNGLLLSLYEVDNVQSSDSRGWESVIGGLSRWYLGHDVRKDLPNTCFRRSPLSRRLNDIVSRSRTLPRVNLLHWDDLPTLQERLNPAVPATNQMNSSNPCATSG